MNTLVNAQAPTAEDMRQCRDWPERRISAQQVVGTCEETQRMVVAGRFVSGIPHDLRTYTGQAVALLDLILCKGSQDVPLLLNLLRQAICGVHSLAEQLLNVGTGKRLQPELILLKECIEPAIPFFQRWSNGITLTVKNLLPTAMVKVNPLQVQQVLINLVRNAEQAIRESSSQGSKETSISIVVHPLVRKWDHKMIGILENTEYVGVSVMDTGTGMNEETLSKIAIPFFTTRSAHGGTGLGLFMCAYFTELNGGVLVVRTKSGEGTVITVCFPVEHS